MTWKSEGQELDEGEDEDEDEDSVESSGKRQSLWFQTFA
jgi:hypothetical protein